MLFLRKVQIFFGILLAAAAIWFCFPEIIFWKFQEVSPLWDVVMLMTILFSLAMICGLQIFLPSREKQARRVNLATRRYFAGDHVVVTVTRSDGRYGK